ncbi:GDP-fucose transporter 1 [Armadillidium nasatum]|uniref:GDP-fucose transporter 1 n=1 Tax=Armadillidium nasatum TaxID=96803 RepID=A0A5N5SNG6_9CRUS|nr:GDP-fucose transporter 1 [Armadillidium nasatum]
MDPSKPEKLTSKYVRIAIVVATYWVVSISMVFLNKKLLGGASMEENDAPLFVTAFQCFITAIVCLVFSALAYFSPRHITFPQLGPLHKNKILPLTIMFVSMMSMNNLCLKYVGVAFYYVGRSLTTVFNVIFTYFILGERTSGKTVFCCAVIIGGFWLGVDQEDAAGSLSVLGVIFGTLASASVSLNAIFTKKVLPAVDGSIWELSYYNNVLAVILFIPLILVTGEAPAVYRIVTQSSHNYWGLLVLSGVFGFAIGFVTGLQIKVTSPLTHNISGTAKACFQTVIATWWYSDPKSILWWVSNWVVLGGTLAYTKVKQLQMKENHNLNSVPGKFSMC